MVINLFNLKLIATCVIIRRQNPTFQEVPWIFQFWVSCLACWHKPAWLQSISILFQIKFFQRMLAGKPNLLDQAVLAIIFGALAVYGTYSGVQTSGAIANIRNLGPMVGGFLGGPLAGLGAGLIGGIHRYYMGGFTALPAHWVL